jgi:hypothetical protein
MISELVNIKRALMHEWDVCEKKHRDSGDDWYVGVMSGIEVAINKVDLMIEHEDNQMAKAYDQAS